MTQAGSPSMLEAAMGAMEGPSVNNVIALSAAVIAMLSVGVAIFVYWRTEQRERRIEKSSAYLDLEVHSSEAFRYQAQNDPLMKPLRRLKRPLELPEPKSEAWETTLNYYFMCLNLFEVCANFRRNRIIHPAVFASWVAWFYDILKDWYFRSIWDDELRSNYTRDVRNIFDIGTAIFRKYPDAESREREFYQAVAYLMGNCKTIARWQQEIGAVPVWPPRRRPLTQIFQGVEYAPITDTQPLPEEPVAVTMRWNGRGDAAKAAAFAGRIISQNTDYISHGEIQAGLSPDGEVWASNLAELYAQDFAELEDRDLLVARTVDGEIAAIAIVAWEESPRRRFAVLEDMAVDPTQRSSGIGGQVVEAVTRRAAERGIEWLFLESGLRNLRAHAFFERHGFEEISHVFARRLPGSAMEDASA